MSKIYTPQIFWREVLVLGLVMLGATFAFTEYIHPALGWPAGGPVPGRSLIMVVFILLFAHAHAGGFKGIGLKWAGPIWLIPLFGLLIVAANLFVLQHLKDIVAGYFVQKPADLGPLLTIYGDLGLYFIWLGIAWTAAAFGEEVIFRGYLLNRVAELLGSNWLAWLAAIFVQALLFALAHAYQGLGSMLTHGIGAIFSGVFFLLFQRSLWPLIIAHGVWDSLGLTLIYMHGAPTTG